MEELKPCPHCGMDMPDVIDGQRSGYWFITCRTTYCLASVSFKTLAECEEAWNRRSVICCPGCDNCAAPHEQQSDEDEAKEAYTPKELRAAMRGTGIGGLSYLNILSRLRNSKKAGEGKTNCYAKCPECGLRHDPAHHTRLKD